MENRVRLSITSKTSTLTPNGTKMRIMKKELLDALNL